MEVSVLEIFNLFTKDTEKNVDKILESIPRVEMALDRISSARGCIERIRVQ